LHREVSAAGPAVACQWQRVEEHDDIDRLAADIAVLIKEQDEEFGSEREIQSWLDEAGIEYEDRALSMALRQLEDTGG
jgi:repressor of nif and glnA expression